MKLGTRIYNTGDMANAATAGTVTAYHPAGKYNPEAVDILYDEERFESDNRMGKMIPLIAFSSGPGRRFWLLDEWQKDRQEKLEALKKSMSR